MGFLKPTKHTVKRRGAQSFVDGVWTQTGSDTDLEIRLSIQPLEGRELALIGGLFGDRHVVQAYAKRQSTVMRAADEITGTLADRVIIDSRLYDVWRVENWTRRSFSTSHHRYVLVESEHQDDLTP